ncbi:hypothetical protein ES707_22591 [subsurface metagenome]
MKILFVPKEFPHGKVIGGPILVYNRIKYLSENHKIGLASFIREGNRKYLDTLTPYLDEIELMPYPGVRNRFKKVYDYFFSEVPPYMASTRSQKMREMVARMTVRSGYDVVLAEYSVMGQYLYKNYGMNSRTKKVVSCHESYTLARRRALELYGFFSRKGFDSWLNLYRLKQYEFAMYKDADLLLTLTPQERERILKIEPVLRIEVVPHGTDTEWFNPFPESDKEISVAFLGNYPHNSNADAVMFFIREIWPDIKSRFEGIKFYIIGRGPTREILSEAKRDKDIIVTGEVDDVRDHLKKAMVFIAPLRLGYGFRGKILEAMAMGIPVVTTSLGAEGLLVRNMENIIIADQPKQFAGAVVQLFEDRGLYTRVSKNSRTTIEEHFSYRRGAEKLGEVLENLVRRG